MGIGLNTAMSVNNFSRNLAGVGAGGAGGGLGAGLLGGLMPLLGPGAISFLPGLLSQMFGGESPQQKMQKQMMKLLTPQNFARQSGQFYQQNLASPAFSQGQRAIAQGANTTSNQVQQNLGARGIGTSGTGAVLSGLTPSLVGNQMAGLYSGAQNAANSQAQNMINQQLQALQAGMGPSQASQLYGAGLASFGPYLQQYMARLYPGTFGTNSPGGGFRGA